MPTGTETIDRTFRKLRRRVVATSLSGAIDNAVTTVVLGSVNAVGNGSLLEINSEVMRVLSVDRTAVSVQVTRGVIGTTAAAHSDGDAVFVDPEFFRIEALEMLNECLRDLYPTLYQIGTEDLTYNSSLIGLNMPTYSGGHPLAVAAQVNATSKQWEYLSDWEYQPSADTSVFTDGQALMLRVSLPNSAKIRVFYPKPFTALSVETEDLVTDGGLKDYMTDLPYYYIVGHSMPDREINRSQSLAAENHQRSQDVPGFLALRTGEWYIARYKEKLEESRRRLAEEIRYIRRTGYGS